MPTAPTTLPSFLSGTPPAKIMTLPWLEAWMPKNWSPDWELFAEVLGRDIEGARGPGLVDGDVDGAEPGVGHTLEGEEVAAFVDDGDVHGLADFFGFLLGRGDDAASVCELNHESSFRGCRE